MGRIYKVHVCIMLLGSIVHVHWVVGLCMLYKCALHVILWLKSFLYNKSTKSYPPSPTKINPLGKGNTNDPPSSHVWTFGSQFTMCNNQKRVSNFVVCDVY